MNSYTLIGLMSGTSMDGVDLALVQFEKNMKGKWTYHLLGCTSYDYPSKFVQDLQHSTRKNTEALLSLDRDLGRLFGEMTNQFITEQKIDRDQLHAISSHGHTVFHQPENGFTLQIGCGATMARITQLMVINDFRSKDIVYGGQGAPLVPMGDVHLFAHEAEAFLNIGGFVNICLPEPPTIACDICPGNLPLNRIATHAFSEPYDRRGEISSKGTIIPPLLEQLNALPFYHQKAPKSLGTEWLDAHFYPVMNDFIRAKPEDLLRTVVEHEAIQIARFLPNSISSLMITGGGAKNDFLMHRISHQTRNELITPSAEMIDFKEAMVFAFLGALHLAGEVNTISSVTGAERSVCSGVLHRP